MSSQLSMPHEPVSPINALLKEKRGRNPRAHHNLGWDVEDTARAYNRMPNNSKPKRKDFRKGARQVRRLKSYID